MCKFVGKKVIMFIDPLDLWGHTWGSGCITTKKQRTGDSYTYSKSYSSSELASLMPSQLNSRNHMKLNGEFHQQINGSHKDKLEYWSMYY